MTTPTTFAIGLIGIVTIGAAILAIQKPMQISTSSKSQSLKRPATVSQLPILAEHIPPFLGITRWWNTQDGQPLTPEKLKGKVVLIDFWTYSCINCIRTYPFIKSMHEKYADKGLVIVGVHTPEFAFEAIPKNVEQEIRKNGFKHPIALDPDYATWNAYHNQYWPAEYFFDRMGRLRHTHFGEGEYETSEGVIRTLLEEASDVKLGNASDRIPVPDFSKIKTPETYFGRARGNPQTGGWTTSGAWRFEPEYAEAKSIGARFRMSVQASKMHLVLESANEADATLEIFVDGTKIKDLTVNRSTLYDIASFSDAGRHTVEIRMKDAGVRFYAATFS